MDNESNANQPAKYRARIYAVMALFAFFFAAIGVRLVMLGNMDRPDRAYAAVPPSVARPDIVDRNNVTLAMDIASAWGMAVALRGSNEA
jgi:cell division protein FtsI/penicillin-binding protein 2